MSKQQQREKRETLIIEQALSLFAGKGFLGVRMSDVAEAAQLSMGTIYSHFAAKEDLLLGCATLLSREEAVIYREVIAADGPAMRRLVTGFTVNWMISRYHPKLVELENLSLMPSVWCRSEPQRIAELNALHAECFEMVLHLSEDILGEDLDALPLEGLEGTDKVGMLLNQGIWGLCVGLNSVAHSGMASGHGELCSYRVFTGNVIHFLRGYGWKETDPEAVFASCREQALDILSRHSRFACPEEVLADVA